MSDLQLPSEFEVTDEYNSHRPLLWMALEHSAGLAIEYGCGYGSTPILQHYCRMNNRPFASFETNADWAAKFSYVTFRVPSYLELIAPYCALLFIDSAPGEERAQLLQQGRNKATILVVHDTEPGAEYVYHIQDTLNTFPYRCDLLVPGYPQTTAVSMEYDFKEWKGLTIEKYKFI